MAIHSSADHGYVAQAACRRCGSYDLRCGCEVFLPLAIPDDAPWRMHDPFERNRPYFRMLFARTPSGGHAYKVFFNPEVEAGWRAFLYECPGEYVSYPEWCGVAPHRDDHRLVWC